MDRRNFLDPRRLADPLLAAADVQPEPAAEPVLLRFGRRAMATTFEVLLPFGTPNAHQAAAAALDEIDRLEEQLTVYRDHSEVSRLNARAHRHPVVVRPNLFALLTLAKRLHGETDGAFDAAVGALIKAWGFYRRAGRVPSPAERDRALARSGLAHVVLDEQRQTVHFLRPGIEINLGSIGKGYALDRAGDLMRRDWGVGRMLLHGGHSSILARGDEAAPGRGWTVGLLDPDQPDRRRALVRLRDRAMATSAATYQHFEHEGRTLGHILDPRVGWPAEAMRSATVTAPTAAEADALATAFFVLGAEPARAYCKTHPEVGAVLLTADDPRRPVVLGRAVAEVEVLP